MNSFRFGIFVLVAAGTLASCQRADILSGGNGDPLSQKQLAALAVNTPYATAVQTIAPSGFVRTNSSSTAAGPTAPRTDTFGPQFSRYFLVDDFVVYRHGKQADPVPLAAATANDTSLGPLNQPPPYQLTYFLVSPDGIVADYAIGSAQSDARTCIRFVAASVSQCESASRRSSDLQRFDAVMRTASGAPISTWNVNAGQ
ncbi:MAG: hypothetical protein AAGG69_04895 [Pseudomonadota bacterium]